MQGRKNIWDKKKKATDESGFLFFIVDLSTKR